MATTSSSGHQDHGALLKRSTNLKWWPTFLMFLSVLANVEAFRYEPVFNVSTSEITNSNLIINVTHSYEVNIEANDLDGDVLKYPERVTAAGQMLEITSIENSSIDFPLLRVEKVVTVKDSSTKPPILEIILDIKNLGPVDAFFMELFEDLKSGLVPDYSTFNQTVTDAGPAKKGFRWDIGNLTNQSSISLKFEASPAGDKGRSLAEWKSRYISSLTYFPSIAKTTELPIDVDICLHRKNIFLSSLFYEQGFTALSFFIAFLVGVALVIVAFLIFLHFRKNTTSPVSGFGFRKKKNLLVDADEALKKGWNTIKDYSLIAAGESIVLLLSLKDKLQVFREIDSLDIVSTIEVDTDIEQQRNEATCDSSALLIQGIRNNKDIDQNAENEAIGNFRKKKSGLEKALKEEYEREKKKLYKKLSAKNRVRYEYIFNEWFNATEIIDHRCQIFQIYKSIEFMLKLYSKFNMYNVQSEYINLSRLNEQTGHSVELSCFVQNSSLNRCISLFFFNLGKYVHYVTKYAFHVIHFLFIFYLKKQQENDHKEELNTMAGHQESLINKAKRLGVVESYEAGQMIEETTKQLTAIKDKLEKDRERQEAALHKKLSELKKQRLAEKEKQHAADLAEFEKNNKMQQTDGPVDPLSYVENKMKILSQQRSELAAMENQIDSEHAQALNGERQKIIERTREEITLLEDRLIDNLKNQGMKDSQIKQLLDQHEQNMKQLKNSHEHNRDLQMKQLQEKLAKNRQEWSKRQEAEKLEQQQLRDHESRVISKLIDSQVSISEEERERIMREHEKQMVKLENSLTLNKLRQKRLLEEKIAMKRAIQMEKLQQKQTSEVTAQKRTYDHEDDSGDESHKSKLAMMKKHAEQKIAVMQGQKVDWDTEMESIRIEMMKDRALSLKEQEERLGAMVASLQLSKAREIAKIEEQQKAINNLKSNLMDEFSTRGVLTNPECQAILERHRGEQEQLNARLEEQRVKQEKKVKKWLSDRLEQREKSVLMQQESELQQILATAPNKTAAKIKQMLLIHKNMLAMEQLRNKLDRQVTQTLEEVRQQHDINRMKVLQEQELQFIGGLVKVGSIPKEELVTVLNMLFPGKTDAEKQAIYNKINTISGKNAEDIQDFNSNLSSSLTERVRASQHDSIIRRSSSRLGDSTGLTSSQSGGIGKKKKKQKQRDDLERNGLNMSTLGGGFDSGQVERGRLEKGEFERDDFQRSGLALDRNGFGGSGMENRGYERKGFERGGNEPGWDRGRMERVGLNNGFVENRHAARFPDVAEEDDEYYTHPPPSQLPPIATKGRKKKKKLLKKLAHQHDEEELL
ncbi:hypothetical protein ScPMuIL_001776 [Solemya velum]